MDGFKGRYEFKESNGIDQYLKILGNGLIYRKVASVAKPSLTIEYDSHTNKHSIIISSIFYSKKIEFKIGHEFEDETLDGRKCNSTAQFDKNNEIFLINQTTEEGPNVEMSIFKEDRETVSIRHTENENKRSCTFAFAKTKKDDISPESIDHNQSGDMINIS